jgi:predicted amidophosphoribosyltransferase
MSDQERLCVTCGRYAATEKMASSWQRGTVTKCDRCWNGFMKTPPAPQRWPICPSCGKSGHTSECPDCVEAGNVAGRLFEP